MDLIEKNRLINNLLYIINKNIAISFDDCSNKDKNEFDIILNNLADCVTNHLFTTKSFYYQIYKLDNVTMCTSISRMFCAEHCCKCYNYNQLKKVLLWI